MYNTNNNYNSEKKIINISYVHLFRSKGKPEGCNCNSSLSKSMKLAKINIIHNKNCSLLDPAIVKLSHSSKRPAKGYGVINVELSDVSAQDSVTWTVSSTFQSNYDTLCSYVYI